MSNYDLMNLCIKNNWFTSGSIRQYDRLFKLNADGALPLSKSEYLLDAICRVIWICSDEKFTYDSIKDKLLNAERELKINI